MNFLSIQSQVTYGHVGNAAVTFPLQRLGHQVWPVPTVVFSNHTGYADHGGQALAPEIVADIVAGLERRGVFAGCAALLSGYIGTAACGAVVLDAVARLRRANPDAVYCCDPVMGDIDASGGGFYVADDVVAFMAQRAAPAADILTPNLYELAVLTGLDPARIGAAPLAVIVAAARRLFVAGRPTHTILITSLRHKSLPGGQTAIAAVTPQQVWLVTTPTLTFGTPPHGAGDCLAALFCAFLLESGDAAAALGASVSALYAILEKTAACDTVELELVAAQREFVAPERRFVAESIGQNA